MNSTTFMTLSPFSFQLGEDRSAYLSPLLKKCRGITYAKCEHVWSYVGKLNSLIRNLMNAAANTPRIVAFASRDFPRKIKNITTHMKLLAIVSVPFSLVDLKNTTKKIFNSILVRDREGVALGTLSFTIIAADTLDSVTTFVSSALAIAAKPAISVISAMGIPLAGVIVVAGTISRTIQIAKTFTLHKKTEKKLLTNEKFKDNAAIKNFIEDRLGIDDETKLLQQLSQEQKDPKILKKLAKLNEKRKAAILRSASEEVVKELEKLLEVVDTNFENPLTDTKLKKICQSLEKIQHHLKKKIKVNTLGILANLFMGTALVMFSIGTGGAIPFLCIAMGVMIRIMNQIYQEAVL